MSTQPTPIVIAIEGKAFLSIGFRPESELIVRFTGDDARAKAEAWWDEQLQSSQVNALYLHEVHQESGSETKHMVKSWSSPYGIDTEPDEDDDDEWDYWENL